MAPRRQTASTTPRVQAAVAALDQLPRGVVHPARAIAIQRKPPFARTNDPPHLETVAVSAGYRRAVTERVVSEDDALWELIGAILALGLALAMASTIY